VNRRGYSEINRAFGRRIKAIRNLLGLTQDELADRVGYSRANIAQMEAGRARWITLHDLENFSNALSVKPEKFLDGVFKKEAA